MKWDYYHQQIRKIKEKGQIDFMEIRYLGKIIKLRLIDDSDDTVQLLTDWRNKTRHMFATNFELNHEKTKKWINTDVLENPDRIQFMIFVDDKKIGIIGSDLNEAKTEVEFDNLMKDPDFNLPGLMTVVAKVYHRWNFDFLKIEKMYGQLFSDNFKILNLHMRCGWKMINVVPLKRVYAKDGWKWETMELKSENDYGERYMTVIELTKENLMKNFDEIDYEIMQ